MRKTRFNLMFYTCVSWLDATTFARKVLSTLLTLSSNFCSPILLRNYLYRCEKSLQWKSWRMAVHFRRNCFQERPWTIPVALQRTQNPYLTRQKGNLSGKINIVNNDTIVGRFDVVVSNVKAPNGVQATFCANLVVVVVRMTLSGIQQIVKETDLYY